MNSWVSIMVPCYNGEFFLNQLLDCLYNQDYEKIHVIIVDDGSTDGSAEIINNNILRFDQAGKRLTYLYQENKGIAGAINLALPYVDGEFCTWMDVDNILDENCISKKVDYLNNHPEKKWVMCKGIVVVEKELNKPIGVLGENFGVDEFAEDLLLHRVNCTPELYMVRSRYLFKVLPEGRHIYDDNKRIGHNMQLLFPMAVMYGAPGRIEKELFFYLQRKESVSHSVYGTPESEMRYVEHIQDIKNNTINDCKFLTEKYRNFLYDKMRQFELIWKTQNLKNYNIGLTGEYFETIFECANIKSSVNSRKIAIWGYCKIGIWWHDNLVNLLGDDYIYYVESDINKCDNEQVMYKDNIDFEKYFLIIPIGFHHDIIDLLKEKGYTENDYYYPEELLHKKFIGEKIK